MANQNLSQFGEKLFVADADHTFIWDSEASISKRVSRNSWLNSGTLTSDAPVTISQTWNNAAVVFTGLKFNAAGTSGTNSSAASLLLDLQVGTVSKFKVDKDGVIVIGAGAIKDWGSGQLGIGGSGASLLYVGNAAIQTTSAFAIGASFGIPTVFITRDADNTLALRNGAAAQTFRVYRSYLNAGVDYERLSFSHDGVQFGIGTERGGSGVAQPLRFFGGSSAALDFASGVSFRNASGGTTFMTVASSGNVGIGTTAPTATLHVNGGELDQDTKRVALFQSNDVNIQNNFSVVGITSSDATVNTFQHRLLDLDYTTATASTGTYIRMLRGGNEKAGIALANDEFVITGEAVERLRISAAGNVGIGTTSPTSKLHVAGNSSPSITLDNTLATGASQLLFKNAVVTGDTDGIFLNGSAQSGFGGAGSINIKATTGPIAFHTASVTNALSIAQNGVVTTGRIIVNTLQLAQILNSNDSKYFWEFSTASEIATFARLQTAPIMQFAGTTNLFPAIKRSTVRLQARLADDSGFTNIQGKLTTDTDYTATVVTPTGFLTLYDAQGTAYRVPCVLAP